MVIFAKNMRILNPKNWQIEWLWEPRFSFLLEVEEVFGAVEFTFYIFGIGVWISYRMKDIEQVLGTIQAKNGVYEFDETLCVKPHNNGEEDCTECMTIRMGV